MGSKTNFGKESISTGKDYSSLYSAVTADSTVSVIVHWVISENSVTKQLFTMSHCLVDSDEALFSLQSILWLAFRSSCVYCIVSLGFGSIKCHMSGVRCQVSGVR